MLTIFEAITEKIRESFGHPCTLIRFLNEHPNIRVSLTPKAPCIALESIIRWHELGQAPFCGWPRHKQGTLIGWRMRDGYGYESFSVHRPEYAQLGQHEINTNFTCDITDVDGLGASKSNLLNFASTDQMVETNSGEMIDSITDEKLAVNLAHREIRIIHSPGSDCFYRYSWDGRIFLCNSGGSHHFAAAKYIAARLPSAVTLSGELHDYELNSRAIAALLNDYEMFVIPDTTSVSVGFYESMRAFKATWLWHEMPRPLENSKAILLPKAEKRSMHVAKLLRKAGATNLGFHLTHLVETQVKPP